MKLGYWKARGILPTRRLCWVCLCFAQSPCYLTAYTNVGL